MPTAHAAAVRVAGLGIAVALGLVGSARCEEPVAEVTGTWRGSSKCVNREAVPACADEKVVYEISAASGKPRAVLVKADKEVDGKRVPMGTLEFTYDEKEQTWVNALETPRFHGEWRLRVVGVAMLGKLTLLPSKTEVRRLVLRKDD